MTTGLAKDISSLTVPFGLFELDPAGIVIRFSPAAEQSIQEPQQGILGRNFFTEVAPVEEVKDFQTRFHSFMADGESIQKFTSTFPSKHGEIKVQILLARITEKSEQGRERLALVRIMPD
jgi:photoactive yellow protein